MRHDRQQLPARYPINKRLTNESCQHLLGLDSMSIVPSTYELYMSPCAVCSCDVDRPVRLRIEGKYAGNVGANNGMAETILATPSLPQLLLLSSIHNKVTTSSIRVVLCCVVLCLAVQSLVNCLTSPRS